MALFNTAARVTPAQRSALAAQSMSSAQYVSDDTGLYIGRWWPNCRVVEVWAAWDCGPFDSGHEGHGIPMILLDLPVKPGDVREGLEALARETGGMKQEWDSRMESLREMGRACEDPDIAIIEEGEE